MNLWWNDLSYTTWAGMKYHIKTMLPVLQVYNYDKIVSLHVQTQLHNNLMSV
jgi:hypothetical protein